MARMLFAFEEEKVLWQECYLKKFSITRMLFEENVFISFYAGFMVKISNLTIRIIYRKCYEPIM